jgi:hypothetical protein
MTGILAVWNDRPDAIAGAYEHWYMSEHIPERLAVPGFRTARRYEAISADRAFFTFYEVDGAQVLGSPAYMARLADPTPLTRSIMPNFLNMVRSVFTEERREGSGAGGAAVVIRYANGAPNELPRAAMDTIARSDIVGARIWQAAANTPSDTVESRIRPSPDAVAGGAVVIETARAAAAQQLAAALGREAAGGEAVGCYRLLCAFG